MLVVAEKKLKNVKILAITCVDGNTTMENVIKNTWRILNGNQRSEVMLLPSLKFDKKSSCFSKRLLQIVRPSEKKVRGKIANFPATNGLINVTFQIPIHAGSVEPLVFIDKYRPTFHGENGMGDVKFWHTGFPSLQEITHPVKACQIIRAFILKVSYMQIYASTVFRLFSFLELSVMARTIFFFTKHPKKVTLIGVGPLTNFALAAKVFPEIRDNVQEIFIMGGNIKGVGNASSAAEFNFFWDPEAAHIVLELYTCKKTILPWETCAPDSIAIPLVCRWSEKNSFLSSVGHLIRSLVIGQLELALWRAGQDEWSKHRAAEFCGACVLCTQPATSIQPMRCLLDGCDTLSRMHSEANSMLRNRWIGGTINARSNVRWPYEQAQATECHGYRKPRRGRDQKGPDFRSRCDPNIIRQLINFYDFFYYFHYPNNF